MTTHMKIPSITSAPGTHFSFALRRDKCSYFVSPAHFFFTFAHLTPNFSMSATTIPLRSDAVPESYGAVNLGAVAEVGFTEDFAQDAVLKASFSIHGRDLVSSTLNQKYAAIATLAGATVELVMTAFAEASTRLNRGVYNNISTTDRHRILGRALYGIGLGLTTPRSTLGAKESAVAGLFATLPATPCDRQDSTEPPPGPTPALTTATARYTAAQAAMAEAATGSPAVVAAAATELATAAAAVEAAELNSSTASAAQARYAAAHEAMSAAVLKGDTPSIGVAAEELAAAAMHVMTSPMSSQPGGVNTGGIITNAAEDHASMHVGSPMPNQPGGVITGGITNDSGHGSSNSGRADESTTAMLTNLVRDLVNARAPQKRGATDALASAFSAASQDTPRLTA